MNTQPNTPASRNEEAVATAAALKRLIGSAVNYPATARSQHWVKEVFGLIDALAAPGAAIDAGGQETAPIELRGIAETLENQDGCWRSCSGCHELNEGHDTGQYSAVLKCHLGSGCSECGGIGAIWDTTDYADMAAHALASRPEAPPASASPATVAQPVGWQVRGIGRDDGPGEWRHADDEDVEIYRNTPDTWELRPVFAQPCASQGCGGAVAIADRVVRLVGEMDDRTSPEDWPEAMLVTGEELHAFILLAFETEVEAALSTAKSGGA